jgi:hypothetical protein
MYLKNVFKKVMQLKQYYKGIFHNAWYLWTYYSLYVYMVIQEESAIIWEVIVCVILSKKVHINMCPILDSYGVMTVWNLE